MKKLILLLFIPLVSFSQTYEEVMSVNSYEQFTRIMLENGYEFSEKNDENVQFTLNKRQEMSAIKGDFVEVMDATAIYSLTYNFFIITFNKSDFTPKFTFDSIYEKVKKDCEFFSINDNQFACYDCPKAQYVGKIGFTSKDGWGVIMNFTSL